MTNNVNNTLTVAFGCGNNDQSEWKLLSAMLAIRVGLTDAEFRQVGQRGYDVMIDREQIETLRSILSECPLKNAFAKAENNMGTTQMDNAGEKSFTVMISAPKTLAL